MLFDAIKKDNWQSFPNPRRKNERENIHFFNIRQFYDYNYVIFYDYGVEVRICE